MVQIDRLPGCCHLRKWPIYVIKHCDTILYFKNIGFNPSSSSRQYVPIIYLTYAISFMFNSGKTVFQIIAASGNPDTVLILSN